jgi:hypothetical protein
MVTAKVNEPPKAVEPFYACQHNLLEAVLIWQRGTVGFASALDIRPSSHNAGG